MLLIVSIITAELYSTFKYHMKIGETTRCCSFFLKTHVKISSKISIIEFNIQIKWCIIVTPSREAEKDYQGYFNSPPNKKNHIATTMINTVLFKISTHIFTRRMTATCTNTTVSNIISTHILTKRMTVSVLPSGFVCSFQLTSSRRGWRTSRCSASLWILFQLTSSRRGWPRMIDYQFRINPISTHILTKRMTDPAGGSITLYCISTHILTKRMTYTDINCRDLLCISTHILTKRMTNISNIQICWIIISTHILTKRMT